MNLQKTTVVGDFVALNYQTATIFSKYDIDFCCKGQRTLEEVCAKQNLNAALLLNELNTVLATKDTTEMDFNSWSLDVLIDYIKKEHHNYVKEKTPVILSLLEKLCQEHGNEHPELHEVKTLFKISADELAPHLKKEELVFFPFVKRMTNATNTHGVIGKPHFGTVKNPISSMMDEHNHEGDIFKAIGLLTNSFTPPEGASETYSTAYNMLKEFDLDLQKHIHLESNILFPKAKALEKFFSNEE